MKKIRNSNIELLRIISMLFIVTSHYTVHNGFDNSILPFGLNRIILDCATLGNIGVILFVLISGYFMIGQDRIKPVKVVMLWLQTIFYSVIIYFICILLNSNTFSLSSFIKCFFPITFNQYWFIGVYMLMYILSPYINKFLNSIDKKQHFKFNLVMLVLFSLLPTLTTKMDYGNELIQFILFYSLGAYFYKYDLSLLNKKNNKILLVITSIILFFSVVIFVLLGSKISFFNDVSIYLFNRDSIIAILFSISLFNIFINRSEFNNKYINLIGSCTLGVYLIHDNPYLRHFLWMKVFKNSDYVYSNYLFVHLLISVLIVFIVCIIVEYARKNLIEKYSYRFISSKVDMLYKKITKIMNKLNIK